MKYYSVQRHWTKRIAPHLTDTMIQATLVRDFNKLTYSRWRKPFLPGMTPHQFESCDWWIHNRRGPMPRFWHYVKHGACHWLVNFNLELAQRTSPKREWRILTSDKHSTVWDGGDTLFDLNFIALGVSPEECFDLATWGDDWEELWPGEHREVGEHAYWKDEAEIAA